jgi:hypothetical protein
MARDNENIDNDNYVDETENGEEQSPSAWLLWLRLWLTPKEAWRLIKKSKLRPETFASSCYYPILALTAIATFSQMFFDVDAKISDLLKEATIIFISFFMSYFAYFPIARLFMNKESFKRFDTDFGKCYVMMLLSTLAVFYLLYECLPFMEVIIAFMPVYTFFLAYQGMDSLRIAKEKSSTVWVMAALLVVLLPTAIYQLFKLIMPF